MNGRPIKRTLRGTRSTSARSHLPGRETFVGEEGDSLVVARAGAFQSRPRLGRQLVGVHPTNSIEPDRPEISKHSNRIANNRHF